MQRWRKSPSPRPLVGRRLWAVGDWGGASQHIGRRWEEVGATLLERFLGEARERDGVVYTPRRVLSLASTPVVAEEVQAAGRPHADAVLLGVSETGRVVLEPVDFKWSLETAHGRQVSAEVMASLAAAALPRWRGWLASELAALGVDPDAAWETVEGFFLAPDSEPNRRVLASAPRSDDEPLDARLVVLQPVDGRSFFSPLPGWETGLLLAALDRAERLLETLDGSERYYRLGAGVAGALARLRTPVFARRLAAIDVAEEVHRLRRERRLYRSEEIVAHLETLLAARQEREESLRELVRSLYPFSQFRQDLAARGVEWSENLPRGQRERWGRLHRRIVAGAWDLVLAEGQSLLDQGKSEIEALAELRRRQGVLALQVSGVARSLLVAALEEDAAPGS
ncbi:MAG TPA: hypothetical protein VIN09_08050 [Chloroflexota bacterium]